MMMTSEMPQSKKIMHGLLATVLWLATAGLGFLAFIAIQDIATSTVALALVDDTPEIGVVETHGWITTTRNVSTIIGGLLWLSVVVGGMEYHFRRVGQRSSYRVFAWTLGIEAALIAISTLLF
jgi:hypothetical protein